MAQCHSLSPVAHRWRSLPPLPPLPPLNRLLGVCRQCAPSWLVGTTHRPSPYLTSLRIHSPPPLPSFHQSPSSSYLSSLFSLSTRPTPLPFLLLLLLLPSLPHTPPGSMVVIARQKIIGPRLVPGNTDTAPPSDRTGKQYHLAVISRSSQ